MSKKASKSMTSKSVVNKSTISKSGFNKSAAVKSSMIKKQTKDEGKSKMAKKEQKPSYEPPLTKSAIVNPLVIAASGEKEPLDPPPMVPWTTSALLEAEEEENRKLREDQIKKLNNEINANRKSWEDLIRELAVYESKKSNDRREKPPAELKEPEGWVPHDDWMAKLNGHNEQLKTGVAKLKNDLEQFEKAKIKKQFEATMKKKLEEEATVKRKQKIIIIALLILAGVLIVALVLGLTLGLYFGLKSEDAGGTTTTMVGKVETMPDGQTGVPGTNGGHGGGQGGGKSAPITTTRTAMSTTTTTPPPMSNYEIACGQVKPGEEECFVGSAPGSCNDEAVCWQMQPEVGTSGDVHKYTNKTILPTPPPPTGDRKRMCKVDDDRLGSCDNGQCIPDGRPIDKSLYEPAEWKDNCDEPSPCWGKQWSKDFVDAERRNGCKAPHCNAHDQAVIWMQHVRCHAGNGRTANETCQGLPLRLWLCKPCTATYNEARLQTHMKCQSGMRWPAGGDGCILECLVDTWVQKASPDGFNCIVKGDGQPGHCFKGQCFPIFAVYINETDTPMENVTECQRIREADKKKEAVFVRGRREAINVDFTANVRPMSEDESSQTDASKKPIEFPKEPEEAKEKPSGAE